MTSHRLSSFACAAALVAAAASVAPALGGCEGLVAADFSGLHAAEAGIDSGDSGAGDTQIAETGSEDTQIAETGSEDTQLAETGGEAGGDAGLTLPPECANPGPFASPTAASIDSQLVGTWIYCNYSIFTGAGAPIDDVGVVIRPDSTWQKIAWSGGQLVPLTHHTDYGTWSVYEGGIAENVLLTWDTTSVAMDPSFAPDGRSMEASEPSGGNGAILAKAPGTK
jgi:hypothetical protein